MGFHWGSPALRPFFESSVHASRLFDFRAPIANGVMNTGYLCEIKKSFLFIYSYLFLLFSDDPIHSAEKDKVHFGTPKYILTTLDIANVLRRGARPLLVLEMWGAFGCV